MNFRNNAIFEEGCDQRVLSRNIKQNIMVFLSSTKVPEKEVFFCLLQVGTGFLCEDKQVTLKRGRIFISCRISVHENGVRAC